MWFPRLRRLAEAHRSGNLYLALSGASALGAAGLYLSSQQEVDQRRRLEAQFELDLASERVKADVEAAAKERRLEHAPVLWRGLVTQNDARLSGPVMLRGARPGAGVDILEEAVGADARYLTVRDRDSGAMGMLPTSWVRREESPLPSP